MVTFKRKAIEYMPAPDGLDLNSELWEIEKTGEIFTNYDDYLKRIDFYKRKNFTNEITGRTGLSYFEALETEVNHSRELKSAFPEALHTPVLKEVHHRVEQRLMQIVTIVHDKFKNDYFPGEQVDVILDNGEKLEGKIREKLIRGDGNPQYTMTPVDGSKDISVDGSNIKRTRGTFSKNLIQQFLRNSLTKETWHGSPWCVKDSLASSIGLPTTIPAELQHSAVLDKRKAQAHQKKLMANQQKAAGQSMGVITEFRQYPGSKKNGIMVPLIPMGPAGGEMQPVWQSKPGRKPKNRFIQSGPLDYANDPNQQHYYHIQMGQQPMDFRMSHYAPDANGQMQPVMITNGHHPDFPNGPAMPTTIMMPIHKKDSAPIAPPIKYPTEDLDVPVKNQDFSRPDLNFLTDSSIAVAEHDENCLTGKFEESSVGSLLEVWNTLNVHNEIFVLDSFTFDDFVEALRWSSEDMECELLSEMHCAILKLFVDDEGKLLIRLPALKEESSDEESEEESEEEEEATPEPSPPRRTTRRSLKEAEAVEMAKNREPTPVALTHHGEDFQHDNPWQPRCASREFRNNMWQPIIAGLLYQISLNGGRQAERCDEILGQLLPPDEDPTDETVIEKYALLDVNLRIKILTILIGMTYSCQPFRDHLDRMAADLTDLRKKKAEKQKQRKEEIETLTSLVDERKTILAAIEDEKTPEQKAKEAAEKEAAEKEAANAEAASRPATEAEDTEMVDATSANENSSNADEDEDEESAPAPVSRVILRKRKLDVNGVSEPKAKRPKSPKVKLTKNEKLLEQVERKIESVNKRIKDAEDKIADLSNDMRETNCQRTISLGKDRFCNRYYWYERNGMPFGGVPSSSTGDYGYANARLWVQGPYSLDLQGIFEVTPEQDIAYQAAHGMSITERREKEEGNTPLKDGDHWGFYDTPEQIDRLIAWLDERGKREKMLKKDLTTWREMIVECMDKLKKQLADDESVSDESVKVVTRVSTRTKNYADVTSTGWKCMRWTNSMALEQQGMKHSEGVKKKLGRKPAAVAKVVAKVPEKTRAKEKKEPEKKAPEKKAPEKKVPQKKTVEPKVVEKKAKPVEKKAVGKKAVKAVEEEVVVAVKVTRGRPTKRVRGRGR
ncbi:hypothetical protein BT63DRAFT_20359 [Microthyrium microscopicum]|uniref:DDT domain-containing protein n=1 Tax=Microthyrium microscopicum TaxID=703497 RepID=A0A6A6UR88_9PEZI|nr:hypothetical protein BT63DRAFT_20359 [Microthyrium microscopicum]